MATKTQNTSCWIWVIVGILLGVLAMILLGRGCMVPKPITQRVYKTDTIWIDTIKTSIDTIRVPHEVVLPEKVYIERTDTMWITEYRDTGTIIRNCLGYHPAFLGRFKNKPKIIEGDFTLDSVSITVLDTNGLVTKRVWPVTYDRWDYHYRDGKLLSTSRILQNHGSYNLKKFTQEANLYGTYAPFYQGFELKADYSVMRGKWGLIVIGELRTYSQYADLKAGVKYQIK